jgi:hypothetical protein
MPGEKSSGIFVFPPKPNGIMVLVKIFFYLMKPAITPTPYDTL